MQGTQVVHNLSQDSTDFEKSVQFLQQLRAEEPTKYEVPMA